jgi:Arc/MetJ-type ribon-helix-helix transcriptional regulator
MWMRSKEVHIKISEEMLEKIDMAARDTFQSRSSFIRESLALRLNGQYITKAQAAERDFDQELMGFLSEDHPFREPQGP